MENDAKGEAWIVLIRRNPSLLASVRTTFKRIVWYGPLGWW